MNLKHIFLCVSYVAELPHLAARGDLVGFTSDWRQATIHEKQKNVCISTRLFLPRKMRQDRN